MMKKLLACDLDGTLIKHNQGIGQPRSILKEDKQAVEDFMKQGNIYIVSTGRPSESTFGLFDREEMNLTKAYYITSNGSEIFDSNRNYIYQSMIEDAKLEQIYQLFLDFNKQKNLEIEMFNGKNTFTSKEIRTMKDLEKVQHLVHACVFSINSNIEEVKPFYKESQMVFPDLSITMNNWYVDLVPANTSKANAIQFILEQEKATTESLYAIGDSWNDISMFEIAEVSYTFHNSPEDVKEKANRVVNHLYECIDELLK